MAYWFLLKNQTHEAGTISQWVGALAALTETWDWFSAPTNICQFQSRRPDAIFCPPQTLHAQNVGINTHIHTRGWGGREGGRESQDIHTHKMKTNAAFEKAHCRISFWSWENCCCSSPPFTGECSWDSTRNFLPTAHISYRNFTTGPLSP